MGSLKAQADTDVRERLQMQESQSLEFQTEANCYDSVVSQICIRI